MEKNLQSMNSGLGGVLIQTDWFFFKQNLPLIVTFVYIICFLFGVYKFKFELYVCSSYLWPIHNLHVSINIIIQLFQCVSKL